MEPGHLEQHCALPSTHTTATLAPHTAQERKERRVVSKSTAMVLLKAMARHEPPPPFETSQLVRQVFTDQTYMQNFRYGNRRHRRVDRLDESGSKTPNTFQVYVNTIELPIPVKLAPLSIHDIAIIEQHGPYTKDLLTSLQPVLAPARVKMRDTQRERYPMDLRAARAA